MDWVLFVVGTLLVRYFDDMFHWNHAATSIYWVTFSFIYIAMFFKVTRR